MTYTLIAYKPNSDCCHCGHVNELYPSDFLYQNGLSKDELAEKLADLKGSILGCCEEGWGPFNYFPDPQPIDAESDLYIDDKSIELGHKLLADRKLAAERLLRQAEERRMAEEEAKEKREFQRLKAKYAP
jgi:hypothetical protein